MDRENSATREPAVSEGISVAAPDSVAGAEPAASAPAQLPSLLDTEATRCAIRGRVQRPKLARSISRKRNTRRCTLPVVVIGKASMNSISFGYS